MQIAMVQGDRMLNYASLSKVGLIVVDVVIQHQQLKVVQDAHAEPSSWQLDYISIPRKKHYSEGSGQDHSPTPLAERARIAHHSGTNLVPASLYMNNAQAWAHRPDLGDACQEVLMRRNLRPWQWRCYIINNNWINLLLLSFDNVVFVNKFATFSFPSIHPTRITPAA